MPNTTPTLQGAPNFRDFGGHPTLDGRQVKRGLLFRSGMFSELTDSDLVSLRALGPKLVVDLRSAHEQALQPSRWPQDAVPRLRSFTITADVRSEQRSTFGALHGQSDAAGGRALMQATYQSLPRMTAAALGALFEELAESPTALPVIVHCTAGKDRTGFVCAALLHALGVEDQLVESDYMLSGQRIDRAALNRQVAPIMRHTMKAEPTEDMLNAINTVEPDYLASAWAAASAAHGSMQAYLQQACGLTPTRQDRLRERLLQG